MTLVLTTQRALPVKEKVDLVKEETREVVAERRARAGGGMMSTRAVRRSVRDSEGRASDSEAEEISESV